MKKYYKLLVIPCVVIIVSLYLIGIDIINRTDRTDDPAQKAAEVAHYLYGTEEENGGSGRESGTAEQDGGAENSGSDKDNQESEAAENKGNNEIKENSDPPELKNSSGKLNINTASKDELMTLDGIGEKYAERIIEARERLGGFTSVEQITDVKGIGQKRFERIKDEITVGDPK